MFQVFLDKYYGDNNIADKRIMYLEQLWFNRLIHLSTLFLFTTIKAALSAGAKFLKKYHSGVWTDGMFTCCNAQGFLAAGCKEIQLSSKGNVLGQFFQSTEHNQPKFAIPKSICWPFKVIFIIDQEPEKSSSSTESHGRRPPSRSLPKAPESGPSITTAADTGNHERRESQRNREKAPLKQTTSTSSSVERQYSSSGGRQESQRQTSLTNPLKRKYQAIFSYRPTSSDELELQEVGQFFPTKTECWNELIISN